MKKTDRPRLEKTLKVRISDDEYKMLQELKDYYKKPISEIIRSYNLGGL